MSKALWTKTFPKQLKEGQRERRDREQREYLKEARAFKQAHPLCRVCTVIRPSKKQRKTRDVHHTRGRAGKLLRDQRFWLPACRQCHNWIDTNRAAAHALGLIAKWEWNIQP